jgi:hypothetical protein
VSAHQGIVHLGRNAEVLIDGPITELDLQQFATSVVGNASHCGGLNGGSMHEGNPSMNFGDLRFSSSVSFSQRRCDLVPARDGGLQADGGRDRLDHTV